MPSAATVDRTCRQSSNISTFAVCVVFTQTQLVLGVMGVDVAINEIKRKTPTYRVSTSHMHAAHMR